MDVRIYFRLKFTRVQNTALRFILFVNILNILSPSFKKFRYQNLISEILLTLTCCVQGDESHYKCVEFGFNIKEHNLIKAFLGLGMKLIFYAIQVGVLKRQYIEFQFTHQTSHSHPLKWGTMIAPWPVKVGLFNAQGYGRFYIGLHDHEIDRFWILITNFSILYTWI